MAVKFTNNAVTTLTAGISSGVTQFAVASASGFPTLGGSDWTYVTVDSEVVKVTAIVGTTFTCIATSTSHSNGDNVELRMTAELLDDFAEDLEAMPKTGGTFTGAVAMSTNKITGVGDPTAGQDVVSKTYSDLKLAKAGGEMSGNITMAGSQTVDGRDISADGTQLDTNTSAIATNVTAIGLNTSKVTNATHTGDVTGATSLTIANDAVTTVKILDDNVTADKLANSINSEITANTAKTTNATHSGEVTGSGALTIANDVVDEANLKISNAPTNGYVLSAQSGASGGLTWVADSTTDSSKLPLAGGTMTGNIAMAGAQTVDGVDVSTLANTSGTNTGDQTIALTGEVTGSGTGSFAATIANDVVDEANLKSDNAPTNDYVLTAKSSASGGLTWAATAESLPSQTGNSGEFLTTNGSVASWAEVESGNTTANPMWEMAHTVSSNYAMTSGNNGISASPITINSSISVTVPSGSTWVIA